MKNKKLIPLFLLLLFISSCSKSAGKTGTTFKLKLSSFTNLGVAGNGGAMIWGRSDKGDMFGSVIDGSGKQIDLSNGSWNFWAVAWEGDGGVFAFRGKPRCAKSSAVLTGSEVNLAITLSNTTCSNTDFSPVVTLDGTDNKFPNIYHYDCNRVTDHNGYSCGKNPGAKSTSKRIIFHPFVKSANGGFAIQGGGLVSECVAIGSNFSNTFIPVGNGAAPIFTDVQSFFSALDCDENDPKGFHKEYYEFGVLGTPRPNKIASVNDGICNPSGFSQESCNEFGGAWSGSCLSIPLATLQQISTAGCVARGGSMTADPIKRLILVTSIPNDVVCSGSRIDPASVTPHPFASGDGSTLAPYAICKEYQLNSIAENFQSDNFQLLADLDMNKTSIFKSLLGSNQPSPQCNGDDVSANFVPIGGLYSSFPGCTPISVTPYTGFFNGNKHSISNIRLRGESVDSLGFIREGGQVKNITFKNIQVEGQLNVGAVSGSNALGFDNVKIIEGEVVGKNYVGGLAGRYGNSTYGISNVEVSQMEVKSRDNSSSTGGLVGAGPVVDDGINIKNSYFKGLITSHGSNAKIGGLIGDAINSAANISYSYSNGTILINNIGNFSAGGLIGDAQATLNITKSYSQLDIASTTYSGASGSGSLAGLVGKSTNTPVITKSFYIGSIMGQCNKLAQSYCLFYALSPNNASTTDSYGALLYPTWSNTPAIDNTTLGSIDTLLNSIAVGSGGSLSSVVNSPSLKLSWDTSPCTLAINNITVVNQASLGRGLSTTNPIILCNRNQWLELPTNQSLHYALEDNLSLGDITVSNMPASFSGSIDGRGHIISGFRSYVASGNGGLFKSLTGKISNVNFIGGIIESTGSAQAVGVVGNNTGVLENNNFDGIYVSGASFKTGIAVGENLGVLFINSVEGQVKVEGNTNQSAGLSVGVNGATGNIRGLRSEGLVSVIGAPTYFVGGVAGTNLGIISETEAGTRIDSANSDANTRIGGLVGRNTNEVIDSIAGPQASIFFTAEGSLAGQAFGVNESTATVKRVLAYNEQVLTSPTMLTTLKHFVGEPLGGASYERTFGLNGSVFENDTSTNLSFSTCTPSGQGFIYQMAATFNSDPSFPDGYFVTSSNNSDRLTRRIVGTHTDGNDLISSTAAIDFKVQCNDLWGGVIINPIKSSTNFAATGFTSVPFGGASYFNNYCPSGAGAAGNYVFKCSAGEFDIVEDKPNGIGFNRLVAAYGFWELSGSLPANYPVWTMEDGKYPRLFLAD